MADLDSTHSHAPPPCTPLFLRRLSFRSRWRWRHRLRRRHRYGHRFHLCQRVPLRWDSDDWQTTHQPRFNGHCFNQPSTASAGQCYPLFSLSYQLYSFNWDYPFFFISLISSTRRNPSIWPHIAYFYFLLLLFCVFFFWEILSINLLFHRRLGEEIPTTKLFFLHLNHVLSI